jgi:hypothetical protein
MGPLDSQMKPRKPACEEFGVEMLCSLMSKCTAPNPKKPYRNQNNKVNPLIHA